MHFDNSANSAKAKAMNSHKSALPMNSETLPFEDPIVNEVRMVRHELTATFDDDLKKSPGTSCSDRSNSAHG